MKFRPALVGFIAAGVGVLLFLVYARRYEVELSGGEGIDVLVAVSRIERGVAITADVLTTKTIPQAYVDDRQIRAAEREKILGLRAAEPVDVSQPLLWTDVLTTRQDKRDLSSLVQPGHRAVTAPFTAMPTFAMIRPGDFVDVIATTSREAGEQPQQRQSAVLLQRVLVLAIGNKTASDRPDDLRRGGGSAPQPILTLSLNLRDAQLLSLASQRSSLSVALRNPNDQRITANPANVEQSDLAALASRDEPHSGGPRRPDSGGHAPLRLETDRR